MVVAGPGTGKTQVLALRIANILAKTDTPAEAILALTYSNAGKQSMRERLVAIIGSAGYQVQIETFHSFAEHVIRTNPTHFVIADEKYQLADDLDKYQIIEGILLRGDYRKLKPIKTPTYYVKILPKTITDLKREGYSPSEFRAKVESLEFKKKDEKEKLLEVASVYGEYEEELAKRWRYDYDDLINLVVREFEENEELLREFEEKYLYLLADEYQDTNSSQNRMLFALANFWGEQANIFVVGDPDQSIYRFQGASLENMLEFGKCFPNAEVIYLGSNYRSKQTLLDGAANLISKNAMRGEKLINGKWSLQSASGESGGKIKLAELPNQSAESAYVVDEIKKLAERGVELNEIAVLFRQRAHGEEIARLLGANGITYEYGEESLLENTAVNQLLKLLAGIVSVRSGWGDNQDDVDLYVCLALPWWELAPVTLVKAARAARAKKVSLWDEVIGEENLNLVIEKLAAWSVRETQIPLWLFMSEVIHEAGIIEWMEKQDNALELMAGLRSLLNFTDKQIRKIPDLTLEQLMGIIGLYRKYEVKLPMVDLAFGQEGVQMLTAHGAKGLEFEQVFIIRATDNVWGKTKAMSGVKLPDELLNNPIKAEKYEDERRLFYVSMTRAKQRLTITMAREYDEKPAVRSMFVNEVTPESVEEEILEKFENETLDIGFHKQWLVPDARAKLEEKEYLRGLIDNGYSLSYSAMADYLECPHKFKERQLLRIPELRDDRAIYGTVMHSLMERYVRAEGKIEVKPLLHELIDRLLPRHPEKLRWQEDLEQSFNIIRAKYLPGVKNVEKTELVLGKSQPIVWEGLPIQGKIDRIDWIDKSQGTVRIVDYKTTDAKSRNALLGLTQDQISPKYLDQLRFYVLLLNSAPALRYKPCEMSIVFLKPTDTKDPDIKVHTFEVEDNEAMENLKVQVHEVWDGIKNLEFEHTEDCDCER